MIYLCVCRNQLLMDIVTLCCSQPVPVDVVATETSLVFYELPQRLSMMLNYYSCLQHASQ